MTKQHIHNSLRFHRKKAGLRQLDVAEVLGLVSTDRISRWEHGSALPHIFNLFKLSALYKVPPQELYSETFQAIASGVSVPGVPSQAEDQFDHNELHTPLQ